MLRMLRSTAFNLAATAVVVALATGLAYSGLGFLGVALVGLVLLFASVRADLGRETMTGLIAMEGMSRAERRARRGEAQGMSRLWRLARILGLVLTTLGGAGFVLLQIPR